MSEVLHERAGSSLVLKGRLLRVIHGYRVEESPCGGAEGVAIRRAIRPRRTHNRRLGRRRSCSRRRTARRRGRVDNLLGSFPGLPHQLLDANTGTAVIVVIAHS